MEKVSYQNHEIRRWDVGPSTFLASPEKGAQLLNWHINMSDGSVRDVVHWPEDIQESKLSTVKGGIPVLSLRGKMLSGGERRFLETSNRRTQAHANPWFCQQLKFRNSFN